MITLEFESLSLPRVPGAPGYTPSMFLRLFLAAACLNGCTSTRSSHPPPPQPPPDFSLSLTLVGETSPGSPLEPAWYVVEPDGHLRAALGSRQPTSAIPPIVRRLNDAQYTEVWKATVPTGALEAPTGGVQIAEGTLPQRGAGVSVSASGQRRTRVYEGSAEQFADLAVLLRRLAWIEGDS